MADGQLEPALGGRWSSQRATAPGDIRARMPRFRPESLDHNLAMVAALGSVAEAKGATVAQLAIAWVLGRGQDIVPLAGTTRRDRLAEMAMLDSERRARVPPKADS
jgi:aryl-alcohol dehydrogenase-like predicted oxidoreductase